MFQRRIKIPLFRSITLGLLLAQPLLGQVQPHPPEQVRGLHITPRGEYVVPMIFPVLGSCKWSDTYGQARDGGARSHAGQDLPAPKLRPLLACFDGVWSGAGIDGDNGCHAFYYHLNNDRPGTDDGKGGEEFQTAPGIWPGVRVKAGQHIAYCGDSGNAEGTIPHLHFELHIPGKGIINPAASLRAAQKLPSPLYEMAVAPPPQDKELRIDGQVVSIDREKSLMEVRIAAWRNASGKQTIQTSPLRRRIHIAAVPPNLEPGDFVGVTGTDLDGKETFQGKELIILRVNTVARSFFGGRSQEVLTLAKGKPSEALCAVANAERRRRNLPPLIVSDVLDVAAQAEAEDRVKRNDYTPFIDTEVFRSKRLDSSLQPLYTTLSFTSSTSENRFDTNVALTMEGAIKHPGIGLLAPGTWKIGLGITPCALGTLKIIILQGDMKASKTKS